jgi:hypothetical protein
LLEKLAASVVTAPRFLSLAQLRPELPDLVRHNFMDLYVLMFSGLLTVSLWLLSSWHWVAFIAAYRLFDIVSYRCYFLLVKSQERPWTADIIRRSILIVAINFYESAVAFAIIYMQVGDVRNGHGTSLDGPLSALYFSLVTMATVGYGDFAAQDGFTKTVVICEVVTSLLLLVFVVPAIVSLISSERTTHEGHQ